jgi:hypothetical protein
MNGRMVAVTAALVCTAGVAGVVRAGTAAPGRPELTMAVKSFLESHGDLCVGKFAWPRDVTEADRQAGSNDAIQLPVLEKLGLVKSEVVPATTPKSGPVTRYSLTAKGLQFYVHKKESVVSSHGRLLQRGADFCVGRLSVDKVVKWSRPQPVQGQLETVVLYTYHIRSADWMADPQARKVFPVVDRIIRGQGNMLMSVTVQDRNGEWEPVLPGR